METTLQHFLKTNFMSSWVFHFHSFAVSWKKNLFSSSILRLCIRSVVYHKQTSENNSSPCHYLNWFADWSIIWWQKGSKLILSLVQSTVKLANFYTDYGYLCIHLKMNNSGPIIQQQIWIFPISLMIYFWTHRIHYKLERKCYLLIADPQFFLNLSLERGIRTCSVDISPIPTPTCRCLIPMSGLCQNQFKERPVLDRFYELLMESKILCAKQKIQLSSLSMLEPSIIWKWSWKGAGEGLGS